MKYDVLGIGLGPANLALATALADEPEAPRGLFLESRSRVAWHPGMLLDGATVQVSFLKDLATLRDPRSRFTFLSYLWAHGRLNEFVNLRTFYPTRQEFNDYLLWTADQLQDLIRYGRRVVAVETGETRGGRVRTLRVTARTKGGETETYEAESIVLGAGGMPRIPDGVELAEGGRIFHSKDFLPGLSRSFADREQPYRFVVVGDGQSAAEVFLHLIQTYPKAEVTAALHGYSYRPMDDSHFVNEIFFPQNVDFFYNLPPDKRDGMIRSLWNTNYSVVEAETIAALYRVLYDERRKGKRAITLQPLTRLVSAVERDGRVHMTFAHELEEGALERDADGLILGTGYVAPNPHPVFEPIADLLLTDEGGHYQVERNYRVRTADELEARIFLQGYCTRSHGIADSLLSIISARSAELLNALREE